MKAITQEWLDHAKNDLSACELMLQNGQLFGIAAFHAQQCAEKCFKAVLEEAGETVPRIHDLMRLYHFSKQFLKIRIDSDRLQIMNSIYISTRYPGEIGILPDGIPTQSETEELFETAKAIYFSAKKLLQDGL